MGIPAWEREVAKQRRYSHRMAEATPLYRLVSAGRDNLVQSWELLFQHRYGALRNEVAESFDKFLECGILRHGVPPTLKLRRTDAADPPARPP